MLYFVASLKPTRPRSLRFQIENAFLDGWLKTVLDVAKTNYKLAAEIAMTRTLVKGYSDTHERGRARYDTLMRLLPQISAMADPAGTLAKLRKAANSDDTGKALDAAIRELVPLAHAAEYLRHRRSSLDLEPRVGLQQPPHLDQRHRGIMRAEHLAIDRGEFLAGRDVFVHVEHIPRHARDVLRTRAAFGQHRAD